jgi:hypothetical protein
MRIHLAVAAAALALAAALPAQSAGFTPFGTGCVLDNQQLAIGNNGLPRIGMSFEILYSGPNFTFNSAQQRCRPLLNLGFQVLGFPIPAILPQQPPGCILYTEPSFSVLTPTDPALPRYGNSVRLAVPNDPSLAGGTFQAQWLAIFEQCGFAGCGLAAIGSSDGAFVTLGT